MPVGILIEWLDHGLKEDLGTEMRQAAEVMEKHRELHTVMNGF